MKRNDILIDFSSLEEMYEIWLEQEIIKENKKSHKKECKNESD